MITERDRREARLGRRLWELGKSDVFAGVTDIEKDPNVIKRRIRAAILGQHVAQNIGHIAAFRNANDETVTIEQAFAMTYGEPLIRQESAA